MWPALAPAALNLLIISSCSCSLCTAPFELRRRGHDPNAFARAFASNDPNAFELRKAFLFAAPSPAPLPRLLSFVLLCLDAFCLFESPMMLPLRSMGPEAAAPRRKPTPAPRVRLQLSTGAGCGGLARSGLTHSWEQGQPRSGCRCGGATACSSSRPASDTPDTRSARSFDGRGFAHRRMNAGFDTRRRHPAVDPSGRFAAVE